MNFRLPSSKIVILFIIGIMIIFFALWLLGDTEPTTREVPTPPITASTTSVELAKIIIERIQEEGNLADFDPAKFPANYSTSSLKISLRTSSTTLESYAANIRKALLPLATPHEHESKIAMRLLESDSSKDRESLVIHQAIHESLTESLLTMEVPADATSVHLDVLNISQRLASLLKDMSAVREQPVVGLGAAYGYTVELPTFYASVYRLNDYFNKKGLRFSPQERVMIYTN